MRKWFASLGILGFVSAAATAQVIPAATANALHFYQYDDNVAETAYKIAVPSTGVDFFSVDFDDDARGKLLVGVQVPCYAQSPGPISVCPDNLTLDPFGHTPDLSSPLTSLSNPTGQPGVAGGFCATNPVYDLPDVALTSAGVHACVVFATNDSGTWLCTDADGGTRGHSYFTTNAYATTALPYSVNWEIRLATPHYVPGGGEFLINGLTSTSIGGLGNMELQFWSADSVSPTFYMQELDLGGPLLPMPGIILQTGLTNFAPNGTPNFGALSGPVPCTAAGASLTFKAFFEDNLDLKKNGHKKIKLTAGAFVNFTSSPACCNQYCFGTRDDGIVEGIWYVQAPAGSRDWFSVHHGFLPANTSSCPPASTLTGIEAVSWDFCGIGPCWADVGVYPANTVLDPSGNTADTLNPVTAVGGASACMPPFASGWSFPGVFYDTPDVAINTTTDYHSGMHWASGDSCTFMGADHDGVDDDTSTNCSSAAPGTYSSWSLDGYSTPATPYFVNWCQRIDWF